MSVNIQNRKKRVVALGFFDGVHRGHAELLKIVLQKAKELNAIPSVMSFDIHPSKLLKGKSVPLINSAYDRVNIIQEYYGIEDIIMAHFDHKMMCQPWQEFITDYLYKELGVIYVVAGKDYHFGDKGLGDVNLLQSKCSELGIGTTVVDMLTIDGKQVHSTFIRELLQEGNVEKANFYLGHPHILTSIVTSGKHLGHKLGFPTINVSFDDDVLIPAFGVYATRVKIKSNDKINSYIAVANIGVRPTVIDSNNVNVEAFILDFDGNLYGKEVRIEFYKHLRGERKFDSLQELTDEVMRNAQQTRDYFAYKN